MIFGKEYWWIGLMGGMGMMTLRSGGDENGTSTLRENSTASEESVILLHGMARSRASMWVLQRRLTSAGYVVLNFPYDPAFQSLDQISDKLQTYIRDKVRTERYHLIGHSLGNTIIRNGFKKDYPPGLGRIVMLAPPNHPPKLAEKLKRNWIYRLRAGDSGQKLAQRSFFDSLPIPPVEFGVIAGSRGQKLTFKEPNDLILTVENAKLNGMKDCLIMRHTHTFLMNQKDTFDRIVRFLQLGTFSLAPARIQTQAG